MGYRFFLFLTVLVSLLPGPGHADTEETSHNSVFIALGYSFTFGGSRVHAISLGTMYTWETSSSDLTMTPEDYGMSISMGVGVGVEAGIVFGKGISGSFLKVPLRTYIVGDMMPVGFGTALGLFFSKKQSFLFMEFEADLEVLFCVKAGIGYRWAWGRSRDPEGAVLPAGYMDSAYCSFSLGYPLCKLNQTTTISTN